MSESPTRHGTIMDPFDLSDEDLLSMPLKTLSRTISLTTSSRLTIDIYLRWLEIHRQEPSKLSEHWSNTLLHWSQSLKSRGFRANELITDVEEWKEQMKKERGPFRSYERRYPPMPADIRRAFGEDEGGWDRERENKRPGKQGGHLPDEYLQAPPKGYVCNRCGERGHHLQVCPTNLNPAFDKPPDNKYVCTCCQARGQHYRSLCPRNTDPYCIYQRRKAQGIVTPGQLDSEYDSQKEFDRMRGEKRERSRDSEYSNVSTPDKKARLRELETETKRLVSEEIADVDEIGFLALGDRQASGSYKRELSTSSNGREKFQKTGKLDLKAPHIVEDFRKNTNDVNYSANPNPDELAIPDDDFTDSPSNQQHKKDVRRRHTTSHLSDSDSESRSRINADMTTPPPSKPKKQYCSFVRQLRKKHPEMKETVNQIKTRPTAVDMIKQDTERQLEQAKVESRSPTPIYHEPEQSKETTPQKLTSQQNDHRASRSPSRESEYYDPKEYPQFDGAFDEKPEGYNKAVPRRNNKLSCFGKGAIGKVKSIANVAKDFPTFKPKSHSASPSLAKGSPASVSQSRLFPFSSRETTKKPLSEKSPNRRLVPAITSALKLTSPTLESLQEDSRALLKPDTPTESIHIPEVVAITPSIQSPDKRNAPTYRTSKSLHSASTETFETFEKESGRPFNPRPFEGLQNRRGASVTPTRSTNEFRHTVRKIIIQGTKADEFRTFSKTFKLSTPMPADIAVLTNRRSGTEMNMDCTHGNDSEGDSEGGAYPDGVHYDMSLPKPSDLRAFSRTFKLATAMPADVVILSGHGNTAANKMNPANAKGPRNNELLNITMPPETKSSVEEANVTKDAEREKKDAERLKQLRKLMNERELLVRKRDLKQFAETFKLPTPMPSDIVALTSKGRPAKQMEQPRQGVLRNI